MLTNRRTLALHDAPDGKPRRHCTGSRTGGPSAKQPEARRLPTAPIVLNLPVLFLGVRQQPAVGVDRARVADQRKHWKVVVGVRVREAVGKIEAVLMCQRAYRLSLGRAMEQVTFEPAGVDTVDVLG